MNPARLLLLTWLLCSPVAAVAEIRVTDATGRQVTLERPAQRIVALAPHIVENVFSAGAGDTLVGVVEYSDYPPAARDIPQVGGAYTWSLEQLVALRPDLVLMWGSGNGINTLPRLESLGLRVYVSEPRKLADISASIRDFGILAGTGPTAAVAADRFDREIKALEDNYSGKESVTVFYQIWDSPLQTVNGQHLISQVIELCGGENIFAELAQLAPQVSLESVLERNPQAIIASGMGAYRPDWLDAWRNYPTLAAVQRGALLHVDPDLVQRSTARISHGARSICEQLAAVRGS